MSISLKLYGSNNIHSLNCLTKIAMSLNNLEHPEEALVMANDGLQIANKILHKNHYL